MRSANAAPPPPAHRAPLIAAFERLCELITRFASGHWGTMSALVLLCVGTGMILYDQDSVACQILEKMLTLISLVLLFLLQRAQTKHAMTVQLKLNELIDSHEGASNSMINIE